MVVDPLSTLPTVVGLVANARSLLQDTHFSKRLAGQVHEICKRDHQFSFSKRALEGWLRSEEAWTLLRPLNREDIAPVALAIDRSVIQPSQPLDETIAGSRSRVVAEQVMSNFLAVLEPSRAVAVQQQWLEEKLDSDPDLSGLPPACWDSWRELRDVRSGVATNLRQLLDEHRDNVEIVARVVEDAVGDHWISGAPHQAWSVLGYYFLAHHAYAEASESFLRAVRVGTPNRAILLSRAAWSLRRKDPEEARRLARRATNEGDVTGIALGVERFLSGSPERTLKTLPHPLSLDAEPNTQLLGVTVKVAALVDLGKGKVAIELLRDAVEAYPDRGILRLGVVQALYAHTATLPTGSMDGELLLAEAADHAARAIPLLRRWGGPTAEATAFACRFYHATDNPRRVLELGRPPPHGTATASDLSREVRLSVVVALLMLGDLRSAADMAREPAATEFELRYVDAVTAESSGDSDPVRTYKNALEAATTTQECFLTLMALARHGITDTPGLADLDSGSPEWLDLIRTTAAMEAGDYSVVLSISRVWRNKSNPHALAHAHARYQTGHVTAAIEEYVAGADRFRDAHFLALAVDLLIKEEQQDQALDIALNGLTKYQGDPSGRWELRARVIAMVGETGDWSRYERHSRALIDEFPDDPRAKWLLIQSFVMRQRYRHAWDILAEHDDLAVVDEATAIMKIQLRGRFESTPDIADMALKLVAAYPDSEAVMATAIHAVMSVTQDLELQDDLLAEASDLLPHFLKQYPESPYLWEVQLDPDDPVESLRPYLEPQAFSIDELQRRARYGQAPVGLLADISGRPYSLCCFAVERCSIPINNQELETRAAEAALDSEIIVDTSALVPPARLTKLWVDPHFERIVIPDTLVDDAYASLDYIDAPGSGTIGWDVLADRPKFYERATGDTANIRQWLQQLITIMNDTLDSIPAATVRPLEGVDPGTCEPWISTLRLAKARDIPLLADDLVLRNLARSVGIPAFDNYAVIQALEQNSILSIDEAEERRRDLLRTYVMDVPFEEPRYAEIAGEHGFGPGPVLVSLSRPAAWVDLQRTAEWFRKMIRYLYLTGRADRVPYWLAAGSTGVALKVPIANQPAVLGQFLAVVIVQSREFVDNTSQLVIAAREVAQNLRLDPEYSDPLRAAVPIIMAAARKLARPGGIGTVTLQMFGSLLEEDYRIVFQEIMAEGKIT